MPIPPWTASGVLPPFAGETPTDPAQIAHQRASQVWKGMLLVDLFSDDDSLGDEWLPKEVDDVAKD